MQDITVVRYTRISSDRKECSIDISDPLALNTSGLDLLIQMVVLFLLKTPGRDYYEPELGGGLLQLVASGNVERQRTSIEANIVQAIKAVEYQIKSRQLGHNYPKSERLKSLGLREDPSIITFEDELGYMINIDLQNEAGDKASFAVPIVQEEG